MPDLARVTDLLTAAYRLLSEDSLGRGAAEAATAVGDARGKVKVALQLLTETEAEAAEPPR